MNVTSESVGGVTVIRIAGELRDSNQREFVEAVRGHLDAGRPRVALEFSGLTYVSSAGLGAIVHVTAQANTRGGRVVLAAPSPFLTGVLEATRLNRYFELFPDVNAAVAALSQQP